MQLPLCALSQVIEHLDMGVPVDSTDDDQNTPLIIAAEGEELIVETLLERGAAIDKQNRNGVTGMSCRRYSAENIITRVPRRARVSVDRSRQARRGCSRRDLDCCWRHVGRRTPIHALYDVTSPTCLLSAATTTLRDRKGRTAAEFAKECDESVQSEMLKLFNVSRSDMYVWPFAQSLSMAAGEDRRPEKGATAPTA